MRITLDTNIFVRFFTDDEPQKANLVEDLLRNKKNLSIPDVVFPELEYILIRQYQFSRDKLIDVYRTLISFSNVKVSKSVKTAIQIFSVTKLDMADCIIAACSLKGHLASFDSELLSVEGVKPYWK